MSTISMIEPHKNTFMGDPNLMRLIMSLWTSGLTLPFFQWDFLQAILLLPLLPPPLLGLQACNKFKLCAINLAISYCPQKSKMRVVTFHLVWLAFFQQHFLTFFNKIQIYFEKFLLFKWYESVQVFVSLGRSVVLWPPKKSLSWSVSLYNKRSNHLQKYTSLLIHLFTQSKSTMQ